MLFNAPTNHDKYKKKKKKSVKYLGKINRHTEHTLDKIIYKKFKSHYVVMIRQNKGIPKRRKSIF